MTFTITYEAGIYTVIFDDGVTEQEEEFDNESEVLDYIGYQLQFLEEEDE
jgi:hypothetical protein